MSNAIELALRLLVRTQVSWINLRLVLLWFWPVWWLTFARAWRSAGLIGEEHFVPHNIALFFVSVVNESHFTFLLELITINYRGCFFYLNCESCTYVRFVLNWNGPKPKNSSINVREILPYNFFVLNKSSFGNLLQVPENLWTTSSLFVSEDFHPSLQRYLRIFLDCPT